jgi:uncharacterized protein YpuA (DUF1002 family)
MLDLLTSQEITLNKVQKSAELFAEVKKKIAEHFDLSGHNMQKILDEINKKLDNCPRLNIE